MYYHYFIILKNGVGQLIRDIIKYFIRLISAPCLPYTHKASFKQKEIIEVNLCCCYTRLKVNEKTKNRETFSENLLNEPMAF